MSLAEMINLACGKTRKDKFRIEHIYEMVKVAQSGGL